MCKTNTTFRPTSTGLEQALVACDLTLILTEGSGCRRRGGGGQLVSLIVIRGGPCCLV